MHIDWRELAKFALVGVLNVAVSFVVFRVCYLQLTQGSGSPLPGISTVGAAVATAAGYLAGIVNSFLLNRAWTFKVRARSAGQFMRFLVLNMIGLALSSLFMFLLVDLHGYPYLMIWFLVTGFVMILNFLGSKYWAFADIGAAGTRLR